MWANRRQNEFDDLIAAQQNAINRPNARFHPPPAKTELEMSIKTNQTLVQLLVCHQHSPNPWRSRTKAL
ncbi:AVN_HP_G0119880.mRNA.1.CDS.1 [Saccharomyces cerevisiae]|nr:AVN_HP_G0119880.mRNA.1.CDS.1 [Saccharomyces cerevisiae]CAI6996988.1 AVN_HP_G0119880.mRNA.1.CDS.1 [Saccharomyces cerevisiae]